MAAEDYDRKAPHLREEEDTISERGRPCPSLDGTDHNNERLLRALDTIESFVQYTTPHRRQDVHWFTEPLSWAVIVAGHSAKDEVERRSCTGGKESAAVPAQRKVKAVTARSVEASMLSGGVGFAMRPLPWILEAPRRFRRCTLVQCEGGLRAWPIGMCSNNDAGRSQSEAPTPCECEQARRQILIRHDRHCESSRVLATKTFWKVNW